MTIELALLSRVAYRDVEITAPRLRSLLALLAAELVRGCSTARLVDGLWPDRQPENPVKALQILVSRARSQLSADVIVSTPTGYRLALAEEEVDCAAVVRHASASAQRARAGDHLAALEAAEAGLAMWAGPPEVEHDEDPLSTLRAERTSTYKSLRRARALATARLGRHTEAVEPLTDLHIERPRDEEVLLELLRCEAATAGQSAALARYEDYRRSLREELGTDPGVALQAMHRELLLEHTPAVRHGVPHEPNPLLGRADDVTAVTQLLHTVRVTSIVGPGGLGKTRLAHAVARTAEQRVVHFVALAGVAAESDVATEVASAVGAGESRRAPRSISTDLVAGIASTLGGALLVLDNCEHVIGGVADLVRDLVAMTEDLRVLTTSRTPLGLSSESVYLLPELALSTAVELFTQRARAARSDVELPRDEVSELCRHLDGLPLAVELAAARARLMSIAEIARRLDDRFALLRGRARDAPERHHTLHAVVDWSWNLLDSAGRAAMRALSVFPSGFTAEAAGYLIDDTAAILEQLVDQSLLKVADTASGARFSMLETVREFSATEQASAGETDRAVAGMLAWMRDLGAVHHDAVFGADPFTALDVIRAEHDNLVQALRQALSLEDGASVAAATALLGSVWVVESNYPRMIRMSQDSGYVLSHFRPAPEAVEVTRTALTVCTLYSFALEGPRATRSLVALRRLPRASPDTLVRAASAVLLEVASDEPAGDSDEPLVEAARNAVNSYGWETRGDLNRAVLAANRMLESLAHQVIPWLHALAHARIAELSLQLEDLAEVRRHLIEALPIMERLGAWPDAVGLRWWMVLANLQDGEIDEAQQWADTATTGPAEKIGAHGFDVGVRAELSLARGDVDTGLRMWREVVEQRGDDDLLDWGIPPGRDPWVIEAQAVAIVAHVVHGRRDLVDALIASASERLVGMLTEPLENPPPYLMELTLCGTLLVALAMADLDDAGRAGPSAVRMIALAERLRYLRNFQPTMSFERIRGAAERTDKAAYADAVSTYAALERDELRAVALDVLAEAGYRIGSRL